MRRRPPRSAARLLRAPRSASSDHRTQTAERRSAATRVSTSAPRPFIRKRGPPSVRTRSGDGRRRSTPEDRESTLVTAPERDREPPPSARPVPRVASARRRRGSPPSRSGLRASSRAQVRSSPSAIDTATTRSPTSRSSCPISALTRAPPSSPFATTTRSTASSASSRHRPSAAEGDLWVGDPAPRPAMASLASSARETTRPPTCLESDVRHPSRRGRARSLAIARTRVTTSRPRSAAPID